MNNLVDASEIEQYFDRLWPIHRSLAGPGARQTHQILREISGAELLEIPSGTSLFDWEAPPEWVVHEAILLGPDGKLICDVKDHNLHLLGYSESFSGEVSLEELQAHLYSRPEQPQAIPYVTSYYKRRWGFCLPDAIRSTLIPGRYKVSIKTEFVTGGMTISEAVVPGRQKEIILFSAFTCHPSMANNELAGPLLQAFLCRELRKFEGNRLTYQFVWHPETVGSIGYLSLRGGELLEKLSAGFGFCCVGGGGPFTYKYSRRGETLADRVARFALERSGRPIKYMPYSPFDGDERQYCSPGFNLPYGCFSRTPAGTYPEYHSSLDDKSLIDFDEMASFIEFISELCRILDANVIYVRSQPFCEPKLDKTGLFPNIGVGAAGGYSDYVKALVWFLNFADGANDLVAIAEKSGIDFWLLDSVARDCERVGLVGAIPSGHVG